MKKVDMELLTLLAMDKKTWQSYGDNLIKYGRMCPELEHLFIENLGEIDHNGS